MASKTSSENIRLGVFVVTGTLLLLIAAYLIGSRQNMFVKTFALSAVFKNVNGLQNGNNVRFSGINIGTVNRIEMMNDTTIYVYMTIEDKMQAHIRKNAIATIGSDGLVGSMLVNIVPSMGKAELVQNGDELQSYSRISSQDMLSTLNVTNENAALLTSDLLKVTQSLMDGKGVLGRLLNDTVMAQDLHRIIANLEQSSHHANATLSELQAIVGKIDMEESVAGVILSDTVAAVYARNSIENLETSSMEIREMTKDLGQLINGLDTGEGMLHLVSKDTTMANLLMKTMHNIEEGTDKFNENMEALKHNFLTRRYFRKLKKEKAKTQKD
ncbi:phospholipid/cholesterol/gamma-HCH transport system substrate-binding protein [Flagellimonas taeanensis]|uniref:Phospholipid/cholesterol/gamma-HCH transport system substrate-binding protein n=1 Tax=Flagellimonas taeanensis TaxID=1005926 RepID=A0A1M6W9G2_9FLAO|nr:MlaD family protein [Allomuricauda taeanensis]SFC45170.1 phospholipid/cholesterol/gamma-HCH transport system substrate-binding protein [Allomuricauda taeanensis]SHK90410.1 phospholipid/cholesterol/gamma-HCH transport system substrate-binding protein [Allomuricauda taeanensis]